MPLRLRLPQPSPIRLRHHYLLRPQEQRPCHPMAPLRPTYRVRLPPLMRPPTMRPRSLRMRVHLPPPLRHPGNRSRPLHLRTHHQPHLHRLGPSPTRQMRSLTSSVTWRNQHRSRGRTLRLISRHAHPLLIVNKVRLTYHPAGHQMRKSAVLRHLGSVRQQKLR